MGPGSLLKLDDYRQVAPRGAVDILMRLGERLRGRRFVHVSASRYGGAGLEVLNRLVPIMNDLGVETTWEITIGTADFDQVGRAVRACWPACARPRPRTCAGSGSTPIS